MAERLVEVNYHFDNIEKYPLLDLDSFKTELGKIYLHYRNVFADIFNSKINDINEAWDETGEPPSFGDYAEDVNPKYVEFIKDRLDDDFKEANDRIKAEGCMLEFYLDDICDIRARIIGFEDVSIWINIKLMEEDEA